MKKPILNQEERLHIKHDTYFGAKLSLALAWLHFKRELGKAIKDVYK